MFGTFHTSWVQHQQFAHDQVTTQDLWPYYVNCSYFVHSIGMLSGTCNCDPFARTKGSFCGNLHEQSSFFDGFSASHSSSFHTSGYLVPNRRPFPYFFDNRVGYLCGIVQVRELGWTSRMRRPLEEVQFLGSELIYLINRPLGVIYSIPSLQTMKVVQYTSSILRSWAPSPFYCCSSDYGQTTIV